jgi:hypothetical protein
VKKESGVAIRHEKSLEIKQFLESGKLNEKVYHGN